jgi:hypothetical protein
MLDRIPGRPYDGAPEHHPPNVGAYMSRFLRSSLAAVLLASAVVASPLSAAPARGGALDAVSQLMGVVAEVANMAEPIVGTVFPVVVVSVERLQQFGLTGVNVGDRLLVYRDGENSIKVLRESDSKAAVPVNVLSVQFEPKGTITKAQTAKLLRPTAAATVTIESPRMRAQPVARPQAAPGRAVVPPPSKLPAKPATGATPAGPPKN